MRNLKHCASRPFLVLLFLILFHPMARFSAQSQTITARRIQDLHPGSAGSFPTNLIIYSNALIFSATTPATGWELWQYNGVGASLVADINDTSVDAPDGVRMGNGSFPRSLTEYQGALFFSAHEPRRGEELWRFDGTVVTRAADINPDSNDAIKTTPNSSSPSGLTVFGNILYFSANTGGLRPDFELWKFDGTTASLVRNIHPDIGTNHSSYPTGLTVFKNTLIFSADDGVNGYELWKHDGTQAILLTNINPGDLESSSYPKSFTPVGEQLYFQAYHSAYGYELWKTDGDAVSIVENINAGAESSYPDFLQAFNGALYFRATDGTRGFELWKYDGQAATLASDINPAGDSFPKNLTVLGRWLCFAANDGVHGWELWKFDGITAELVTDLNPAGDSFPEQLAVFNGYLYFSATTPDTGYEVWRFDGTNVTLAADLNVGPGSSFPQLFTGSGSELVFRAAEDGLSNWEPWVLTEDFTPAILRVTAVEHSGTDIRLKWTSSDTRPTVVQAADRVNGAYQDISGSISLPGGQGEYLDIASTPRPSMRFYRIVQR